MQLGTHKTLESQSIFDIALMRSGTILEALDIAVFNEIAIDDDLPSEVYYETRNNYMVSYLADKNITTGGELIEKPTLSLSYSNSGLGNNEDLIKITTPYNYYRVRDSQTIYDVALQLSGSMESVIDILLDNNLSLDINLKEGTYIRYTGNLFISEDITTHGEYVKSSNGRAFSDGFSRGFN